MSGGGAGGGDGPGAGGGAGDGRRELEPRGVEGRGTADSGIALRALTRSDLPRTIEIEDVSFAVPWRRPSFEALLARDDSDLIAAVRDDELVGYAVVWTIMDQAELGNVAVAPAERGRGTGRRLVGAALDRARARGAEECFLEVRESNRAAIQLYESLGFEVLDRRPRYYTRPVEDAFVMRARLS